MIYKDREDAAFALIPKLEEYRNKDCVVMAIPRGGVPLGYVVARHFGFPMELLLTKKIGHPNNREYAIGAVSLETELIDENSGVPDAYLQEEISRIRQSLRERRDKFMGNRLPVDIKDQIVIIIDDGIATGHTMLASIALLRSKQPKKIVVAVPVAAQETAGKIKKLADEFICPYYPEEFYGVGACYEDFSEVTDDDVIKLLEQSQQNHSS